MGTRPELQTLLESLQDGVSVYFQPPPNVQMTYPAIVYNRDYTKTFYADNSPYSQTWRYMITVIDADPDSELLDKLAALPLVTYSRHYTSANLNHDIYELYF